MCRTMKEMTKKQLYSLNKRTNEVGRYKWMSSHPDIYPKKKKVISSNQWGSCAILHHQWMSTISPYLHAYLFLELFLISHGLQNKEHGFLCNNWGIVMLGVGMVIYARSVGTRPGPTLMGRVLPGPITNRVGLGFRKKTRSRSGFWKNPTRPV